MKKIAIYLIMILFLGISCSEDVKVNPELAGPLYGLTKGEPGSVDELIYNTWEEWGMYYLYKFEPYAFQVTNWSGYFNKWYTPVKEENKEVIRKIINHIQGGIFVGLDKDLVQGSWFVRTFLCDSLCNDYDYNPEKVVDIYLDNGDCIILAGVGDKMNNFTDEDWDKWKAGLSSLLISRLYLGATEQPDDFFNTRMKDANGKEVGYREMMKVLKNQDVVFLGEVHNCAIAHWMEYEIVKDLCEVHKGKLAIGLEMLEADNQLVLDEYVGRLISSDRFEEEARLWPNEQTDYAAVVGLGTACVPGDGVQRGKLV